MPPYRIPDTDIIQQLQRQAQRLERDVARLQARLSGGIPVYDDLTYSILIGDLPDGQLFIRDRSPNQLHWIANGTEYQITGTPS